MKERIVVAKFGGTSVADAGQVRPGGLSSCLRPVKGLATT